MIDLLGLTSDELIGRARALLPRGRGLAAAIHRRALREGRFDPEIEGAGAATAVAWREHFACAPPRVVRRIDEPTALGRVTTKLVLAAVDGAEFECVGVPLGATRSSLCLSTQVGCRMACRFCETGAMGWQRDLTAGEIVGQVVAARGEIGSAITNLVFMGMGEPLDNIDELLRALAVLTDRRGLAFAHDKITVCTVGRVAGIHRLARLGWKRLGIALSLNAAHDELRARIMPIARHEPLADLQRALVAYRARDNLEIAVHYCLLPGINDSAGDARGVAAFCAPLGRTIVHLIPYNPGTQPITRPPTEREVVAFVGRLRAHGVMVRRRITKGRSVMAACGQLGNAARRTRRALPGLH